jgi:hypothetical protein
VEGTEHLEDVEETLDAPGVEDWERSEYEDICIGVLVEGTEHGIDHTNTVVDLVRNLEEFISNSTSVRNPLPVRCFPVRLLSATHIGSKAKKHKARATMGNQKRNLHPFSCCYAYGSSSEYGVKSCANTL